MRWRGWLVNWESGRESLEASKARVEEELQTESEVNAGVAKKHDEALGELNNRIKELEGALKAEEANSREVIRELNEKLAAARDTLKVHVELSESSSEMHAKLQAEQAAALASAQQDARNALERLAG